MKILLAIIVVLEIAAPAAARPLTMADLNYAILQANIRADMRQVQRPAVCVPRHGRRHR